MGTWAAAGHLFTTCHRERGGGRGQQGSDHRSGSRSGVLIYACNCYLSSLAGGSTNYFGMLCNDGSGGAGI